MTGQWFPTAAVVGATSGVLLGDFDDVVKVLEYVLDDKLWTHQLPAASRAAEPALYAQHPWLTDLSATLQAQAGNIPALTATLANVTAEHGDATLISPAGDAVQWRRGNAISDAIDLFGDRLTVVELEPNRDDA